MQKLFLCSAALIIAGAMVSYQNPGAHTNDKSVGEDMLVSDSMLMQHAHVLSQKYILVDTHVDFPYVAFEKFVDPSQRLDSGCFDYVRAKEGGLNAPFMSIYIPAELQLVPGRAKQLADSLIDMVEKIVHDHPDKFAVAKSPADIRAQFAKGLVSLPMGIENGAAIEDDLKNLEHFYRRGVRYITLTHGKVNKICDSSFDKERKWNGLSPFGEQVVAEMNRVGIMVDVAHISDSTFYDVIKISKAPVLATHSGCRHFTPGFERNMSDEMIKKMAEKGGVIQINFSSYFLNSEFSKNIDLLKDTTAAYAKEHKLEKGDPKIREYRRKMQQEIAVKNADIAEVADHIDHVVKLVGVDHVGFGSDFDGVGPALPDKLKDVSMYPNLIFLLLKRGYSDSDIEKICSGNVLRVWSEVEKTAAQLQQAQKQ